MFKKQTVECFECYTPRVEAWLSSRCDWQMTRRPHVTVGTDRRAVFKGAGPYYPRTRPVNTARQQWRTRVSFWGYKFIYPVGNLPHLLSCLFKVQCVQFSGYNSPYPLGYARRPCPYTRVLHSESKFASLSNRQVKTLERSAEA